MANTTLNMQLLLRRDDIFNSSYVLEAGEPGFEVSTNTLKIGDGTKTWAELPIANKAAIDALIKVVDDKVAALGDTYATDAEVEVIRKALQAAIDDKVAQSDYDTYTGARQLTDTQITDVVADAKKAGTDAQTYAEGVAGDLSDYETSNDAKVKAIEEEIDTFGDIVTHDVAEFATAAQGAKADAAAVKADVDAAIENITKADGLIAAAKSEAIAAAKNETESQVAALAGEGNTTTVKAIDTRLTTAEGEIDTLQNTIQGLSGAMHFKGTVNADPTGDGFDVTGYAAGDVVIFGEKEYVFTEAGKFEEFGDVSAEGDRIKALEDQFAAGGRVTAAEAAIDALEVLPATDITATQISNWDKEVGAKALAETKTTAAQVKTQIEAYGYATEADLTLAEDRITTLEGKPAAGITADDISAWNNEIGAKEAIGAPADGTTAATGVYKAFADADVAVLAAAQEYADSKEHKDTTYSFAAGDGALELDITPSVNGVAGATTTVTLNAPTVDVGVTKVIAGNDIVVTPAAGTGEVTVAHETFTTGEYTKDPSTSDKTGDVYMMTSVAVDNGHVTGANVKSLAYALEAMSFILNGGNSAK